MVNDLAKLHEVLEVYPAVPELPQVEVELPAVPALSAVGAAVPELPEVPCAARVFVVAAPGRVLGLVVLSGTPTWRADPIERE
jgi:hypothetical protein